MTRYALVFLALAACGKKQDDSNQAQRATGEGARLATGEGARPATGEGARPTTGDGTRPTTANTASSADSADLPYKLKPLRPTEAQDIATLKQRVQSDVREWLSEETTSDGYILTYSTPVEGNVQDEVGQVRRQETGLEYGVYVRRMIDGAPYKCVARLPKREDVAAVVAACKTAKP